MDKQRNLESAPATIAKDWEPAYKALLRFEAMFLDRVAAKATFADCLRDGVLRSRARYVSESRLRKIGAAWTDVADEPDEDLQPAELRKLTWRRSIDWRGDQTDWRWPVNKFSVTVSTGPFRRQLMHGVEFFREDVDRILRKRRLAAGGAPKRDEDWTLFWHNVIAIAKSDRLSKSGFRDQRELRSEILEAIGEALDDETIKKPVSQIWNKFVA